MSKTPRNVLQIRLHFQMHIAACPRGPVFLSPGPAGRRDPNTTPLLPDVPHGRNGSQNSGIGERIWLFQLDK